jgi:hypothetical protein
VVRFRPWALFSLAWRGGKVHSVREELCELLGRECAHSRPLVRGEARREKRLEVAKPKASSLEVQRGPEGHQLLGDGVIAHRLGNDATSALPNLKELAARHWSWSVRKAAAEAASTISGEDILPRAPACRTHPVKVDDDWQVGSWRLHPLQPSLNPTGSCSSVKVTPETTILIPEGAVCLVAEDRGKWGGSISAVRETQHAELRSGWDVNPASAFRFPGGYLVVERLRHVGLSKGVVSRLTRDGQGTWHAEQLVELPGFPFSHAVTEDGKLLLLADTQEEPCPGDPRNKTTIAAVNLLSIAWDGTVESLP